MRILKLRAVRDWTVAQTAERFLLTEETVTSWMRRVDEGGDRALVQTEEPVHKFPDRVAYVVRSLKLMYPSLGKARIAQMLARPGVLLGVTTVGRMLKRDLSKDDVIAEESDPEPGRTVTAKRPNHVYYVDLTVVPAGAGLWVPWLPFAMTQRWPFCWWVAVVMDHYSRLVVGFAIFKEPPTSKEVCAFLDRAIKKTGKKPKYIIIEIVLRACRSETVPPPAPQENEPTIELLGWLVLALDDAPALVVTGFEDGKVPETKRADAYLPNRLRQDLGLIDDSRRLARDLYATELLVHSRSEVAFLSGRRSLAGEPQVPSASSSTASRTSSCPG